MTAIVILVCVASAFLLWQLAWYLSQRPPRIRRDYTRRGWWE